MNKREYDRKMKNMGAYAARILTEKFKLEAEWQCACKHPVKYLSSKTNYKEDEYGRDHPSRTDYDYICSRCNTRVQGVKLARDVKHIQELLFLKAHKNEN